MLLYKQVKRKQFKKEEQDMTKQELIKMVGSEVQADYALEIILKNLKPSFIRTVVQTELNEVDREINTMEMAGYIVTANGQKRVNWGKAMKLVGWNLSEEQQAEYEEVYTDRFYGTLKSQVEKQLSEGQNVIFDVDVVGGCNIKKFYGERALSVFIQPPSVEELRKRLNGRGTDTPEVIESRIAKAEFELSYADKFDVVIVNDQLEKAQAEALETISNFLKK